MDQLSIGLRSLLGAGDNTKLAVSLNEDANLIFFNRNDPFFGLQHVVFCSFLLLLIAILNANES